MALTHQTPKGSCSCVRNQVVPSSRLCCTSGRAVLYIRSSHFKDLPSIIQFLSFIFLKPQMTYLRSIQLFFSKAEAKIVRFCIGPSTKLHTVRTPSIFARTGDFDTPLRPFFWLPSPIDHLSAWTTVGISRNKTPYGKEPAICYIYTALLGRICNTPQFVCFYF